MPLAIARPKRSALLACAAALLTLVFAMNGQASALSRVKDLASIEGVRQNQLVGYGIVVGLNGTGDTLNNIPFTRQSLQAMLERLGVNTRGATMRTQNLAAVMVTASLPPFATQGNRIDITVSSLGDAKSLQGGTLLVTPLLGADGEVYALAQGSVAIAGFSAEGDAAKITRGVPTNGRVPNGAMIERETAFKMNDMRSLRLSLRNPGLHHLEADRGRDQRLHGRRHRRAHRSGHRDLQIPAKYNGNMIRLVTEIEQLKIEPDQTARVVVDERSGIIVMGRDVRVSTVAIAQGNLTVTITEQPQVSQPAPLSNGTTTVVPRTGVKVDTGDGNKLAMVKEGVTLRELVDGLNALGVGPRDLISILQAIKAAGALQADIEVM